MSSFSLSIDTTYADPFLSVDREALSVEAVRAVDAIRTKSGEGADSLGWVELSLSPDMPLLIESIQQVADRLRSECLYIVCVGIGGSYLGARAVIEALSSSFDSYEAPSIGHPKVLFAGQSLGGDYLHDLLELLRDKPFGIINISKSGTTTEPAVAFRLLRRLLLSQETVEVAKRRIVAITDKTRGALRQLADQEGYDTFTIPDDVGGRFSVLTPVGLLPIAVAGFDIRELHRGEREQALRYRTEMSPLQLPAVQYAMRRQALYRQGFTTEAFVAFEPQLAAIGQWWTQLFGESEGKDHKGILPISLNYTTDLHSMGQWVQQGERTIMETFLSISHTAAELTIPREEQDPDGLNYLAKRSVREINQKACQGTLLAHVDGGVPVMQFILPRISEQTLGALIYTMEYAVAVSGYMQGVNPFDQPGVEEYKKNLFALLKKPGYEAEHDAIDKRLKQYSLPINQN